MMWIVVTAEDWTGSFEKLCEIKIFHITNLFTKGKKKEIGGLVYLLTLIDKSGPNTILF